MARIRNGKPEYVKLEQRMVLLAWLNGHLGYESNRELLSDMKETSEGFDASGHSYIYHHLEGREDKVKIPLSALTRYDDNIREHLRAMNSRRSSPIVLRYFQYLAVLYTEIFLDWYFRRRGEMVDSLNVFIEKRNAGKPAGELNEDRFSDQDLKKLAYWMATGSGKTLIMHINYRQFLHYNPLPLDNILLITPNEGLSEQHIGEMAASSIPARRFDLNESGLMTSGKDAVRVIEITKLVEEKRGGGVSVPVEAFEGNNLIFVDEGHKGSGGEAWRRFREALSETGFTFEYSATFGQALTAARNDRLTAEYGKAILFDYSYRYFHGDGYGKDFHILNLKEEATQDSTETLALGNLLSFYEQQRVFDEQAEALRPYNLERPLWVFVGSTVNAVYTDARQKRSDVLTVVRFLHHVLENRRGWVVKTIGKLMAGKTGLVTPDGQDVFEGKFDYLREAGLLGRRLPAAVDGGDHAPFLFHKNDRQAVGCLDDEEKTGEARNRGITPKLLPRYLVDEVDDIGVHLVEEEGFEAQSARKLPQVSLPPGQIAKTMPDKRDALEPRNCNHRRIAGLIFHGMSAIYYQIWNYGDTNLNS